MHSFLISPSYPFVIDVHRYILKLFQVILIITLRNISCLLSLTKRSSQYPVTHSVKFVHSKHVSETTIGSIIKRITIVGPTYTPFGVISEGIGKPTKGLSCSYGLFIY
jgi:hypothetical protein